MKKNKRLLDLFLATLCLLIAWPFMLIIALVIKCVSPGPAVYKADRVGNNGKIFKLYKFRSMNVDSGKVRITTLQNDDRVFSFGRFLRKSKLDEVLQIFNIFKSEMTVVGFRPEDIDNAETVFSGKYKKILNSFPGLTSPASLFDYTHGELYESEEAYVKEFMPIKMEIELYYAENSSFWYDIQIIFRTAWIIVCKILGKKKFTYPPEYSIALDRLAPAKEKQVEKIEM